MLRLSLVIVSLGLLVPAVAISQVPKADDTAAMRARYLGGLTVQGRVTQVDAEGEAKKLTVQVSWQTQVVDDKAKKKLDDLTVKYNTAFQKRDNAGMQRLAPQITQAKAGLYKTETQTLDLAFTCDKDAKVRRSTTPPREAGAKPYTAAELAQLRGTGVESSLAGYAATFKDVETDVHVKVTLDKPKASKMKKDELEAGYPINFIMIVPKPEPPAGAGVGGVGGVGAGLPKPKN